MKKTKLFGTRIIENIQVPRTPNIIMFDSCDSINNMKFDKGDLLDAGSIKKIINKIDILLPNSHPRIVLSESELDTLIESGGPFLEGYDYMTYEEG